MFEHTQIDYRQKMACVSREVSDIDKLGGYKWGWKHVYSIPIDVMTKYVLKVVKIFQVFFCH